MALAAQAKKYTYPSQHPGAMTGGLGPLASQAAPGPGAQMVTPVPTVKPIAPAASAFSAMSAGPYGGGAMQGGVGGVPTAVFPASSRGNDLAGQRAIEAGREGQRNQLLPQAAALTSPESWSFAGMPPEFWKAEQAKQETTLRRKIAARRTQLEQQRQAGTIGAAEYDFAIKSLAAEESQGLAGIQSDLAMARMSQGEDAALKRAGAITSLYGAIPSSTQAVDYRDPDAALGLGQPHGGNVLTIDERNAQGWGPTAGQVAQAKGHYATQVDPMTGQNKATWVPG